MSTLDTSVPASPPASPHRAGGRRAGLELLGLLVVLLLGANLLVQVVRGLDAPPRSDYLPFVTGARVLQSQPGCLYCMDAQAREQEAVLGYRPTAGFPEPFVNPPLTGLLLRPLTGLPLRTGMAVFVLVLLAGLGLALRLAGRLLPTDWSPRHRLLVVAAAVVSVPAATAMVLAQWVPLLLLAAVGAVLALRSGRAVLAGALLAALLVKPQTVWMVVPLLVAARSWRVLVGFGAGAAGWAVSGLLLVGPGQMLEWPRLVLARHVSEAHRTVGLPGMVADITGHDSAAFVTAAVLAAGVVGLSLALRRRLRGRTEAAIAAGIALSLACAPHVFPDDLMLLALPLIVWASSMPPSAVVTALSLSAAYEIDGWMPTWAQRWTSVVAVAAALLITVSLCRLRRAAALPGSGGLSGTRRVAQVTDG